MKQRIFTDQAPKPVGPYSQAVKVGNFLFVAGQIGIDPKTGKLREGFEEQVKQTFENISAILSASGYSWEDVVRVVVYLKDLSKFSDFNRLYQELLKDVSVPPVRSTIEVSSLPLNALVEIEVTAYKEG
ncbi:Rid family detoxifying hydrolase [Thermocrinis sp.]|jgi:2-iminobutanoate/2-iminopropanoate deaminase|uniref:RidA family protein n=1 Tax=Thermocrinis sp. TaxID=2024383 RepID=UPI00260509DE|nr:Rid family detoxifying hydrolase [Thermocrinis sp.]